MENVPVVIADECVPGVSVKATLSSSSAKSTSPTDVPGNSPRSDIQSPPIPDRDVSLATWDVKMPDDARVYSDFFTIDFITSTIQHLIYRDWSTTVFSNIVYMAIYHVFGFVGLYQIVTCTLHWQTVVQLLAMYYISGLGVTAGMHRLWSHRSYKASTALEVFLAWGATMSFENSIFVWCRDHRVHHKYSETNADPHNSHRGLFFAHIGWLVTKKHPDVKIKGADNDMDDLKKNKIIMFQQRYYLPLVFLWTFILPTLVPWYFWGESLFVAYCAACFRLTYVHHGTWLVNSIAHWQGPHPYDATMWPCENMITAVIALGEGWHNYHHRFPNDYRTSDRDFGPLVILFNFTQFFLDTCGKLGLCWDLYKVPPKLVKNVVERYGEGSH